MNAILFKLIVAFIIADFVFSKILDYLNINHSSETLPPEAEGIYNAEEYAKSRQYGKAKERLGLIGSLLSFAGILLMLFLEGFAYVDGLAASFTENKILHTLIFFGILGTASSILGLPFQVYGTFVIEEKFGFNKTTPGLFVIDKLKGLLLSLIIGGGILALLTWLFYSMEQNFWWIAWAVVSGFSLFMATFYTSIFVPIFNKLTPLEDGELRNSISEYADKVQFPLKNIFVIDGSKRSTKANAFFSGIGKTKSIVLYDTLINEHSTDEITAVLAHEVGHYKKKHIVQSIIISLINTGILFFLFGQITKYAGLGEILSVQGNPFHISLLVFGLLYSPVSMITGILMNMLSRKNEFEADNYAKTTYSAKPLGDALKKLTGQNLGDLTPHPLYVFMHYSHPPVLERLKQLEG